ncbi:Choline dehydrogenase, mitochondrial [Schistosoma japonicum]|nr:Choline dehydrogenase, mitochondrial [Schistosoma japonicum]
MNNLTSVLKQGNYLKCSEIIRYHYYCINVTKRLLRTSCDINNIKKPIVKNSDFKNAYEYIIIGAGSAGCVLANRLSLPHPKTNNSSKVLVLEAGPTDVGISRWTIKMPAALMYNLYDDKYNWYYHTVPQRHMNDRAMYWPRGRVLGGSSSLNAMVYIRGHALDYDRWESEGADVFYLQNFVYEGWSYANCLPYFRKAQTHELGGNQFRGSDGPLYVSRGKTNHPLHLAWIEAGKQAGYPFTDDVNGYQQEGVGYFDMTIKNGERCSAATAYLHPALKSSSNLTVETNATVTQILFENNRAVGVKYKKNGQVHEIKQAKAESEVILSGGAINSPHLLMLSGIGDVDYLRSVGIDAWHHLPGVGQNLQDHLEVYVQQACKKPITLYKAQWKYPHMMVGIGLKWILFRQGWAATTHLESGGFVRTSAHISHPNIQFHFLPSTIHDHGRQMGNQHAFQVHVGPMRARSSGQILLSSASSNYAPMIDPNYLACETDRDEMRAAIRLSREIFAQPALANKYAGNLNAPVIMMAEKAADMIISSRDKISVVLPADLNASYWKPKYPDKQRDGIPFTSCQ